MRIKLILPCLALMMIISSCMPSFRVQEMKCEGLSEPLGIDSANPHFSWKISSSKPMEQVAYELQVASSKSLLKEGKADLWSTGRVMSNDQVMVPYKGKALSSRQQCWWRVRIWKSEKQVSEWSEPQRFGIGIVGDDHLQGDYIGAVPGDGRSPLLRKSFTVEKNLDEALLYVNSLGYHEAYINGAKVSDAVLQPAVSQLDKRSLIVVYDVTDFLKEGTNEIVLWTSSGWYKPKTFGAVYDGPLVKAELDAVTADGMKSIVCTDSSWKGTWSGYSDYGTWLDWHFGGEKIDARIVPSNLDGATLDKMEWVAVDVVNVDSLSA